MKNGASWWENKTKQQLKKQTLANYSKKKKNKQTKKATKRVNEVNM